MVPQRNASAVRRLVLSLPLPVSCTRSADPTPGVDVEGRAVVLPSVSGVEAVLAQGGSGGRRGVRRLAPRGVARTRLATKGEMGGGSAGTCGSEGTADGEDGGGAAQGGRASRSVVPGEGGDGAPGAKEVEDVRGGDVGWRMDTAVAGTEVAVMLISRKRALMSAEERADTRSETQGDVDSTTGTEGVEGG